MSTALGIISLGCPRNLVDSQTVIANLAKKDFKIVSPENADVVIVNTCAFVQEAKQESIDVILDCIELKKRKQIQKLIVYGCLAQRYGDQLTQQLKEVDAFVGTLDVATLSTDDGCLLTPQHFAYIKIAEGCGNSCSYCAIPHIKGALRSRPQQAIIEEVQSLERRGVKEINLVGQDISLYGRERHAGACLTGLVKDILAKTRIPWIRLLYLHPAHIDDALLELIAGEPRICNYVDVPIQHCSDRILQLMRRTTSRAQIVSLIQKIRKKIPGVFLRTSVIAGFPTETEKEFQELLSFISTMRFERLGAFVYSREEGTDAYSWKGHLPQKTKQHRFDALMKAQQEVAVAVNESLLGTQQHVLIDEQSEEEADLYLGRLAYDAPEVDGTVYVRTKKKLAPGEFHQVKIIDTFEYDVVGELL